LAFTLGISVLIAFLFALLHALQFSRPGVSATLRGTGRGAIGASPRRWDGSLVIIEVALSVIIVIGTGLLLNSFVSLLEVQRDVDESEVIIVACSVLHRPATKWSRGAGFAHPRICVSLRTRKVARVSSEGTALAGSADRSEIPDP
jgi:hypothetical protein